MFSLKNLARKGLIPDSLFFSVYCWDRQKHIAKIIACVRRKNIMNNMILWNTAFASIIQKRWEKSLYKTL